MMHLHEWQYQRLSAISDVKPDKLSSKTREVMDETDTFLVENGLIEIVEVPVKPEYSFQPGGTTRFRLRTEKGTKLKCELEAYWEAWRKNDPEHGPAEFVSMETSRGVCVVRVPKGCPEIADYVCRDALGSLEDARYLSSKEDHTSGFLDGMDPEGMPYWRSFTGRPLGTPGMEMRVGMGLDPFTKERP
jgi:hypothetical protein